MPDCKNMKAGHVYECKDCGLQLQVVHECVRCSVSSGGGCPCNFVSWREAGEPEEGTIAQRSLLGPGQRR